MQIQSIQPYSIQTNNKIQNIAHNNHSVQLNHEQNNAQSVYATNVYGINFGAKKEYNSSFEKEISQQANVLNKLSNEYFSERGKVNMDLNITPKEMKNIKHITIIASGSSKNAGEMAAGFIEKATKVPVNVVSASEYMFKEPQANKKDDLAIVISQSGGTADTLAALNTLKDKNVKTIAITNKEGSKIADAADSHIYIQAGKENAVAATKTVTSSIYSLMAVGLKLGEIKGSVDKTEINRYALEFKTLPRKINRMLEDTADVKKAADVISNSENIYYYAKGSNTGAVREGALKLTETTGKRVIADSSSEALHGTFASIKPENPVLQIAVGDINSQSYETSIANINEMTRKRHIKNPIIIKSSWDNEIQDKIDSDNAIFINIPHAREEFTPILATVRFQQITNEVTKNLGIDPDNGGGFLTKYRQNMDMK